MRYILAGALLAVLVGAPPVVGAQVADPGVAAGATFQSYTFQSASTVGVDKISLTTVPFSARAVLGDRFDLTVNGAFASATLTRPGSQASMLSGLTDTEIRLTYALRQDRIRLSAVGLAPTGKAKLTASEMDVAGVVAADLLPFAITNWGTGGGIGVNAAFAIPAGDATSFGLSAGYVVAREFEPLDASTFAYRPGNQLQIRAAADHTIGSSVKGSLQVVYLHYSQDQGDGANLYQAGDRLQGVGSLAFSVGASDAGILYGGYLRRQQGKYTDVVLLTPSQDLIYTGVGFRHSIGGAVLVPSVDVRLLGNEAGVEQGNTIAAGTGLELTVGQAQLVPSVRARFGRLTVRSGQESGFTGLEFGITLRNRTFVR
jgi:hypothetical protein